MCGIFGYVGLKDCKDILLQGLQSLEYRGYDSAGIAILNNKQIQSVKQTGKVKLLKEKTEHLVSSGTIGIAHTRWATHGEPNEMNAHPHKSCNDDIYVVHNGIVENADSLKEYLKEKGHTFLSETDTEVIPHLIEEFLKQNDFEKAVKKTIALLEGTYGLAILHAKEEKIICTRKGSPLIVGYGNNEYFISSDIPAVAPHTKEYYPLKDGEICTLTKRGVVLKNEHDVITEQAIENISWDIKSIEKQGFEHFMLKEIFEQPDALRNCLRGRLKKDGVKISVDVDFSKINRIIILGCGTSWHAGLIARTFMEELLKIPVQVEYASEFRYAHNVLRSDDLVIAISQSGETADTLSAVKKAKETCRTIGIINVVGSSIAREVDSGVYIHTGPEIGVASTKAFTGQLTALFLLTLHAGLAKKTIDKQNYADYYHALQSIPEKIESMLTKEFVAKVQGIAEQYYASTNALFLGRGINFPTALEGALKLKEISYIHAEGYPAAEMKHGPIALIDDKMPVICIASSNGTYEKLLSNIQEVKSRKGIIISIASKQDVVLERLSHHVIYVPSVHELLTPIINVIPLQLLAYKVAVLKGLDPDKPRNLAKSVTVE
jgi:glutamine---fructose-6-phosphate transaminase (isomerizing)